VDWAPKDAVLVFEALHMPQPERRSLRGKALRRRLSLWQRGLIRQAVENKAEERGMAVAEVDPRGTSKNCSRCGLRGIRRRHDFRCPHCGHRQHADLNAAVNIGKRFTVSRDGGAPSTAPEVLAMDVIAEGKPLPLGSGS
jgi:IS605 OrfB family transposase